VRGVGCGGGRTGNNGSHARLNELQKVRKSQENQQEIHTVVTALSRGMDMPDDTLNEATLGRHLLEVSVATH
jgi:hypothetical protein